MALIDTKAYIFDAACRHGSLSQIAMARWDRLPFKYEPSYALPAAVLCIRLLPALASMQYASACLFIGINNL
jgi:hypothetical protein